MAASDPEEEVAMVGEGRGGRRRDGANGDSPSRYVLTLQARSSGACGEWTSGNLIAALNESSTDLRRSGTV